MANWQISGDGFKLDVLSDTTPIIVKTGDVPANRPPPIPPAEILPLWTPTGDGVLVKNGRLRNSRNGCPEDRADRAAFNYSALTHSSESAARNGIKALIRYLLGLPEDKRIFAGYHVGIGLDEPDPVLLANPAKFRIYHGREWNDLLGVVVAMKADEFDDLTEAQQRNLAGKLVRVWRWAGCLSVAKHPENGRTVKDGNELTAVRGVYRQDPQPGSHLAHDWCISDRDGDGVIERSDDWKRDPGEPIMRLARSMRNLPVAA